VHVFDLDSLRHHAQLPAGALPTALGFAQGQLWVALANHRLLAFDVEQRRLALQLRLPRRLPRHWRVCGLAAPGPGRLLLWGHGFLLGLELRPEGRRWRLFRGLGHLLAVFGLDEAHWGSAAGGQKRKAEALALALEVRPERVEAALPAAFERKKYVRLV